MSGPISNAGGKLRLRLPATSANLGPGFDTAAVALDLFLDIEAEAADRFSIEATGRDADQCGQTSNNLVLELYRKVLDENGREIVPLRIRMDNQIPLGMGCGSSASGRLAAIALAVHFGALGWSGERILAEASALEGHPDNAAACWLGGFVAARGEGEILSVARVEAPADWRAVVVLPTEPLATSKARAVLPERYSREDVVANLQSVALLTLAFAQGRGELLRTAMEDCIHQPYRSSICPLLPLLLPLAGTAGILGVALSGAGPGVLVIVECEAALKAASEAIKSSVGHSRCPEMLVCRFAAQGAQSLGGLGSF
jgi:homoserine kinase